jgi:hypothetical protein
MVDSYKEANINFVDQYAYVKRKDNQLYYPVCEMYLTFGDKEPILIWSSSSGEIINSETVNVFLAASTTHGAKLSYRLEDSSIIENFMSSVDYDNVIYIKGRRAITNPYWWYKGTETSKGIEYLSDKILSDFYTRTDDKNIFCKYTDIYIKRSYTDNNE